jgi:ribokinase
VDGGAESHDGRKGRVAVVGHVEWVEFVRVARVPIAGEIVHARETWSQPAGGGSVAAMQLVALAEECVFFTALGDDGLGRSSDERLEAYGIRVEAGIRDRPTRRAFTYVDDAGERTITLLAPKLHPHGDDPLPWERLDDADAVYFCAGDVAALQAARRARVLVATARELTTLVEGRVELDALVRSGVDAGERYAAGQLNPPPRLDVATAGRSGGRYTVADGRAGRWKAAAPPGPIVDAYGAGDCFAAGLAYALGQRLGVDAALAFAARCAAGALTGPGAYVTRVQR